MHESKCEWELLTDGNSYKVHTVVFNDSSDQSRYLHLLSITSPPVQPPLVPTNEPTLILLYCY